MANIYTLDPHTIRFDDKYVTFNVLHTEEEYESTKAHIERLGQLDPILMLDGMCVDGRHRTRIAKELGTAVRCVDLDPDMEEKDIIAMCNKSTLSGRDYDATQKAVQALKLTKDYSFTQTDAATLIKVPRKLVSYAAAISGYGRNDILDTLVTDKKNKVQLENMPSPSRSLELIAKFLKSLGETPLLVIDESERIQWSPDAHIKTEAGKAWYYAKMELLENMGGIPKSIELEIKKDYTELANMKYKLKGSMDEQAK